ncbi:MAG TPA: c-type cytochrome biogenesis protein CcmI [Porticoccaceae bacterium]|nr:c-type cytochrome biogenesis protein CcmI [Porticoccaceae bacterium]
MTEWLVAAALLLMAALFITFRQWFPGRGASEQDQRVDMNRQLFQERLAELEVTDGSGEPTADSLVIETQRQFLADQSEKIVKEPGVSTGGGMILMLFTGALLVLALVLYARLGALPDEHIRGLLQQPGSSTSALRDALDQRLEQKSDNIYYWLLLARMEVAEENLAEAEQAYRHARKLAPDDATVAAELAQTLFMKTGQQVNGEIESLVIHALKAEPDNSLALELAGIVSYASGDYPQALIFWQRAVDLAPPGSVTAEALQAGIDRIRSLRGKGSLGAEAGNTGILEPLLKVQVELDESLAGAGGLPGDATVFIYIREWQGASMPLAAQRFTVAQLPLMVTFSDAMSLSAARKLSSVAQWEVVARVAVGGQLQASAGDLEGRTGPVSNDFGKVVELIIDSRLP